MAVTIVGNNTPTAGGVVYGDGTNYASTAAGSAGQVLQSNGSSAPSWATPATGAMSLITTVNASGASQVDFTGLSTSYQSYQIIVTRLYPSGTANMQMRVSTDNGSSFLTDATYTYGAITLGSASYDASNNYAQSYFIFTGTMQGTYSNSMLINIFPNTAGTNFSYIGFTQGVYNGISTPSGGISTGLYRGSSTAVNAIRLFPNTGTISGLFKLYGISA